MKGSQKGGKGLPLSKRIADKDTLIIDFGRRVRALSSTIMGGGLRELTHAVFHRVDPDFNDPNPVEYVERLLERLGLPGESSAVFLTAVDAVREHIEIQADSPTRIMLVASVGLGHGVSIEAGVGRKPGTINILLLVGKSLTDNALIDLAGVVSSAKTLALVDLALSRGYNLSRVYATATDALVIASAIDEVDRELYGGPATPIGSEAARLVYEAIVSAGLKSLGEGERFRNIFGVNMSWIADTASKIYRRAPLPGLSETEVRREVAAELRRLLRDPNIWALALAARNLDWYGLAGALPELGRDEYLSDSKKILTDELLGITLALYINGWRALFAYYWVDSAKEELEEFGDKPMFMDDILASLIGSILSRIYDRYLAR